MEIANILTLLSHILFTLALGYYLITNLQWYNYKLQRVIFKHKKQLWHLFYFLIPLFAYYLTAKYFWIYFYLAYLPALYLWQKKLDKKLVFTARVWRFFGFLLFSVLFQDMLCLLGNQCQLFGVFLPLLAALGASYLFEKFLFLSYKRQAEKKLQAMQDLKIIAITASYGKTSIKNFLYQILSAHFNTYMTPRSVNTLGGLVKDINVDLPSSTKIYIAEAGARVAGDIDEIARFLNHHYAIVGSIGPQHIEYFKTLENIRNTKMEILHSKNLQHAFIHTSAEIKPNEKVTEYGQNISNIKATLEGLSFDVEIEGKIESFHTPLLGAFHAINLTAAILVAKTLGLSLTEIKKALQNLKQVSHRLEKIEAGGKLIIDDSFNGNFEGMSASYDLVKAYQGRKVLITPGIIESDEESNVKLAHLMDEVFDTVIITGAVNAEILVREIKKAKKVLLRDKAQMEEILAKETKVGDLILFSNDAPTFI
jgi:UDP-N-acetylmuramoyl-tripeptide--D-alanyl-D-alanine ligase